MTPELMARAVRRAFELQEASWNDSNNSYDEELYVCCLKALNEAGLDVGFSQLMALAMDAWPNDVEAWCAEMIEGKENNGE